MQILFPNPFGWTLPSAEKVTALQQQYGFSDTYAEFLRIQNGFRVDNLWDNPQRNRYLTGEWLDSEHCIDLRLLFGIVPTQPHFDLEDYLTMPSLFAGLWFPIGMGYGGDEFAEILHGKYQGYIASFDHGLLAHYQTLEEVAAAMGIQDNEFLDKAALCDRLCAPELGFAWLHAPSFAALLQQYFHIDERGRGFLTNEPSATVE